LFAVRQVAACALYLESLMKLILEILLVRRVNVVPGKIVGATNSEAQFRYIEGPFPQGQYRVTLVGTPDPAVGRPTMLAMDTTQLDGEPTQFPSGNGIPGGDFVFTFTIA